MIGRHIPIASPVLHGREREYVLDCIDSNWISSRGSYVERFERSFAEFCGTKYAVSTCNGTAALHLALAACGVGPGDEVIVPTLTFVATANAVTYCGATPRLVDVDPRTWNLDPDRVEAAITPKTRAIIAVHLYGNPVDVDAIERIAERHGIVVIEDAAEAHGASWRGRRVGGLGHVGVFSFYGNKIVTTGEGGMVVTNDPEVGRLARQLCQQGTDSERKYWFPLIGFNYRMTNVAAAIGLAQLEDIDDRIARYREVASWYKDEFADVPGIRWQSVLPSAEHAYWMVSVVMDDGLRIERDTLIAELAASGVESRPVFYPMHVLPPYRSLAAGRAFPEADRLSERGISLPTWAGLTRADVDYVGSTVRRLLAGERATQIA